MADGNWTTLLIAGEAILVSLAVGGWLFVLLRRERRHLLQSKEQVELLARRQASVYLDREMSSTLDLAGRTSVDDRQMSQFFRLRLKWLEMEKAALQREGGERSDPIHLRKAAKHMLSILTEPGTAVQVHQRSGESLKQVIFLQKDIINRLRTKLASAEIGLRDAFDRKTLNSVSENVDTQLESVSKLEKELEASQASYKQVSDELARLQERYKSASVDSGSTPTDGTTSIHHYKNIPRAELVPARSLVEAMQASHTESMNELGRMREANSRQRAMILELDGQLTLIQNSSGDVAAPQALLDSLKQQLRDYENCTASLEMETDDLRVRIASLNRVIEVAETEGSSAGSNDSLREAEELAAIKMRAKLYAAAFKRLADIATQKSAEDAINLLRSGFGDPRLIFVLFIKGKRKEYWLSNHGESIDDTDRKMIRAIVPSSDTPWVKVDGGAVYAGASLKLYLRLGNAVDSIFERTCQFLTPQLQIIDTLVRYLDLQADPKLHDSSLDEALELQLAAIDIQHDQLCQENARLGTSLQDELRNYIESAKFSPVQAEVLKSMLDDLRSQFVMLSKKAEAVNVSIKGARNALGEGSRQR